MVSFGRSPSGSPQCRPQRDPQGPSSTVLRTCIWLAFAALTACSGCREETLRPTPADIGTPTLNLESHLQAGMLAALSATPQADFATYAARELALYGYRGLPAEVTTPPIADPTTLEVWARMPESPPATASAIWLVAPGESPRAVAVALETARQVRAKTIVGLGERRLAGVILTQERGLEGCIERFAAGGILASERAPIFLWLRADHQQDQADLSVRGPTQVLPGLSRPPQGWNHGFSRAEDEPLTAATAIEIQLPSPDLWGAQIATWLAQQL
jgi:hypothetical protein